jgi:pyroglutamyl-peptidase
MADDFVDVVLTGFEPFGGRAENRSWQVVEAVPDVPGVRVAKVQLPVDFTQLARAVTPLVPRARRALVLIGESAQTSVVEIERVALNVVHARIPDNRGAQPRFEELAAQAPLARYARWDAARVADVLAGAGVPVHVSHHAGTYACNASLYLALHEAETIAAAPPIIGFIHVPVVSPPETSTIAEGIARLLLTFE